jgi:hypothetical protein
MSTDINMLRDTTTGAKTTQRSRIKGYSVAATASAGRLTITDGNGGAELLDIDLGAAAGTESNTLAGNGILAQNGIYVSAVTNITAYTIFYTG